MKIFLQIMWALISWLKYPIILVVALVVLFFTLVYINVFIGLLQGKRFKKGQHNKIKKRSAFKKLFIDLPKQVSEDMFNRDPEQFRHKGMIIFEGRQGEGKSIAMCHFAREMQQEYPKSKCISNLAYKYEDGPLNDWRKLIDYENGKYGVIAILDETQNWFSSNQSKNFPPEMLEVITQNRKNRRIILGTAQNFYLLAKAIRSQATEVRRCTTLLGALTIVRKYYPVLDSDGNVKEWKYRGMYFFVHNKKLRESYDTYKVIKSLRQSGFQERTPDIAANTTIIFADKKKK